MKIKTYRTQSVTKALEEIKKDLGSDAVILNTKRTKTRGLLGLMPRVDYEITAASEARAASLKALEDGKGSPFRRASDSISAGDVLGSSGSRSKSEPRVPVDAYEVAQGPPRRTAAPAAKPSRAALMKRPSGGDSQDLKPQLERLAEELEELKKVVSRRQTVRKGQVALSLQQLLRSADSTADWQQSEEAAAEMARMMAQGLDRDLAHSLLRYALRRRSQSSRPSSGEASLRPYLREALQKMVRTSPIDTAEGGAAIFIGPTGVGKTTTIAKLAAIFALGEGKRVQLITLDNYRIAAAEQLRTYADIIGVALRAVNSIDELEKAMDEAASRRDCVLIDTTGHSHKKTEGMAALSAFLRRREDIEKHLVLSITTKPDDLREIIEAFGDYAPDKLVFTKLDETSTHGSIAGEVILSGIPLSYLTDGQAVPDDIQVPDARFVSELVIPD